MRRAIVLASVFAFAASSAPASALVWPDVPERVERGLTSPDPVSRRAAARDLANVGLSRGGPLVLKALGDPDVDVRVAAAQSAIRLRVLEATDAAIAWLSERETRLRVAACEMAQAMPSPRVASSLARALGDSDPQVRALCAEALGAQGSPDVVTPLSGKLDDSTPAVRTQVARALARLGDPRAVVPLVGKVQDSVPEVRQAVVRALGDLGDNRATQALLLALRDNVAEVRIEALSSLGRLHAPEAVDPIAPLTLERNIAVRQAAFVALGRIGTPAAVRALVRALGTQDDAAGTLEHTPMRDALVASGPAAVPELVTLLDRPVAPAAATSAAWVLGELRATSSAPAIVAALRKGALPPNGALRGLAGAGTPDQVPVVLEFVADPSPMVRDEALRAAGALLDPSRPDGRAVEPLVAALRNARTAPQERAAVAALLGRTGAPRAAVELAGLVGSKDATLRVAAIDALGALGSAGGAADDTLVPLLADHDAAVRLHAAVALGASGGPTARRALVSKLDSGEEVDRFAVLSALGGILSRLPDDAASARLFTELAVAAGPERDAVIEAAGRARSPSVVTSLASAGRSADADDRRAVAAVLAAHRGSVPAVAIARSLLGDGDASVRAQAAFALGSIGDGSLVPSLASLVRGGDVDVATNAAAAIARIASREASNASALLPLLCPMLADGRAAVRTNALVAVKSTHARCSDGQAERKLLLDDTSDLVRIAAARVVAGTQGARRGAGPNEDRTALERCAANDRSAEVARACRLGSGGSPGQRPPQSVTIFIVGETSATARPRAPFLLEYEDGVVHAGIADRRGATFDPVAPAGEVVLRRADAR